MTDHSSPVDSTNGTNTTTITADYSEVVVKRVYGWENPGIPSTDEVTVTIDKAPTWLKNKLLEDLAAGSTWIGFDTTSTTSTEVALDTSSTMSAVPSRVDKSPASVIDQRSPTPGLNMITE